MKIYVFTICAVAVTTTLLAQTKKWSQFEVDIPEEVFNRAWAEATNAPKDSRLTKWTTPANSAPPFKLGNGRGIRFFSDWEHPTRDLEGLIAKIVIYGTDDRPIGQPQYVTIKGFWNSEKRPKNIGVTIMLAPGGATSSAQIWLVANGQRASTGMFKL